MEHTAPLVEGQLVEGNCIIALDAAGFAKECAERAERLHKIDPELAKHFLQAMNGLSIKMENCSPTHTTNYPPRHGG